MDPKKLDINTRNWVDSAQDMDYWRVLVNAALKLRVLYAMDLVYLIKYLQCLAMICFPYIRGSLYR